ncbi:MAG: LexA family transcriptional regulator [Bacteroidota bacterium]|nr:LexA family transcriptional regulator [Bacteroidota bacterium]MDP4235922.1 LexA family transcriptional regulator [Bacteroidota bacterium]
MGIRLREFYTQKGIKRKAFSDSIGWQYDTIRAYEEGRAEPGSDFYTDLLEVYPDADVIFIITGKHFDEIASIHWKAIPILHDVKAGTPVLGFPDIEKIGTAFTLNMKDKDLFALRVRGNSMEPEISEGDLVVCAPQKPFVSGKLYVVVTDDSEATIKQVWKKANGYELVARNPEYPVQVIPDEKVTRLIRVVEITRKYD